MTRDETKALIQYLSLHRPNFPRVDTQEEMGIFISDWLEAFQQYDSVIVRQAAASFLRHNPYEPKIADLQKEIDQLIDAHSESVESVIDESPLAQEYWGSQQAIDAVGYDENTSYAVIVGEMQRRLPTIRERQKTRATTPPQVTNAIRELLGSAGLYLENGDNQKAITGGNYDD